jgi:hypothetical protein
VDKVRACPHLRIGLVELVFERLPKRASIWGRWKYRECRRSEKGATQINAVTYLHGQRMTTAKTVTGLDPEGIDGALKIIRRSLRQTDAAKLDTKLFREDCA